MMVGEKSQVIWKRIIHDFYESLPGNLGVIFDENSPSTHLFQLPQLCHVRHYCDRSG